MSRLAIEREVETRFTGMIFLLRKAFEVLPDGRLRLLAGPAVGYARRRPRRA